MQSIRNLHQLKSFVRCQSIKANSCHGTSQDSSHKFRLSKPKFDEKFLLSPENTELISENIRLRKGFGNIHKVHDLKYKSNGESEELQEEMAKIPNLSHPDVIGYEEPKVVEYFNEKPSFMQNPLEFSEICKKLNLLRMEHLGNLAGHKSYFLIGDLSNLEQALIKYATAEIIDHGFNLVTVPDILPAEVIKSCGMKTDGERNQVYRLLPSNLCLSGTSEMALAGYFAGERVKSSPTKVTAVSRCFRAETSNLQEEKGVFRVHQFTKVEMFAVCRPTESAALLEEFRDIEIKLFRDLGLHFKLLDMPPSELGAPAYRKYDIEAWMPGRKMWGEISSSSNCTDYQARRLNIKIDDTDEFAHTVNGTAMAIPRMLIAIVESFQREDGSIEIPKVLRKFMNIDKIVRRKNVPELKLVKNIR